MTSSPVLLVAFVGCAALSLFASSVLITRIERLGTRWGMTEALLGLVAAAAADTPEVTSALTAMIRGQNEVGIGVVLGANVFQLAALLGLGALAAGGLKLQRDVVLFEGLAAVWIAVMALGTVSGTTTPWLLLGLALVVFVPYVVLAALPPERRATLPLPSALRREVSEAIEEEEEELEDVMGEVTPTRSDGWIALVAIGVVIAASTTLEHTATELGARWNVSDVVIGAVVLGIATSLPNLVAAIHLAKRGRGAATLSEAMNSNRINTLVGLLIPAAVIGIGVGAALGGSVVTLAWWYVGMTVVILAIAYVGRGLNRIAGAAIVLSYAAVIITLVG